MTLGVRRKTPPIQLRLIVCTVAMCTSLRSRREVLCVQKKCWVLRSIADSDFALDSNRKCWAVSWLYYILITNWARDNRSSMMGNIRSKHCVFVSPWTITSASVSSSLPVATPLLISMSQGQFKISFWAVGRRLIDWLRVDKKKRSAHNYSIWASARHSSLPQHIFRAASFDFQSVSEKRIDEIWIIEWKSRRSKHSFKSKRFWSRF